MSASARLLFVFGICAAVASPSLGVVIVGTGNTSSPTGTANAFWNNVGQVSGSYNVGTGIYLGDYWVLTASHVGIGPITLGGTTYQVAQGSARQVANPPGLLSTTNTDMFVYRIAGDPLLTAPSIYTKSMDNEELELIGYGRDRQSQQFTWDSQWRLSSTSISYRGYMSTTNDTRTKRWGTNRPYMTDVVVNAGNGDVMSFGTLFDSGAGNSEAVGVEGDSGGAVFAWNKTTHTWQLAGMIHAQTTLPGQPAQTVILDNSITYAASMSYYNNQISLAKGASLWGDYNADRVVNVADINLLSANAGVASYDLTHDGITDDADRTQLVEGILGTRFGDTNLDKKVAIGDLVTLAQHWNGSGTWADGDFTGDGLIRIGDLVALAQNWGFDGTTPASAAAAALPEPLTAALLAAGLPAILLGRRHSKP
jgi:hypothetical protein